MTKAPEVHLTSRLVVRHLTGRFGGEPGPPKIRVHSVLFPTKTYSILTHIMTKAPEVHLTSRLVDRHLRGRFGGDVGRRSDQRSVMPAFHLTVIFLGIAKIVSDLQPPKTEKPKSMHSKSLQAAACHATGPCKQHNIHLTDIRRLNICQTCSHP